MMKMKINMFDLILCLTNTADMVSPEVSDHHKQVAYLSFRIAEEFGLAAEQKRDILLAGLLHDIGAFSVRERLEFLEYEDNAQYHAHNGSRILQLFPPLSNAAKIIKHHHLSWDHGKGAIDSGERVPLSSHIIHLADRAVVLIDKKKEVLGQVKAICEKIKAQSGDVFMPELVDVFLRVGQREYVWLDIVYDSLLSIMPTIMIFDSMELDMEGLINLTRLFSQIIDFRSPYTANHSSGVAASAERLAALAGFSPNECRMMKVAGYLHDLGKIAVMNDVLEKQGALDEQEFNAIRSHTFHTFRTLQNLQDFETINQWASLHHERLDGSGYPFHMSGDSIPLGSRIMAVADVFTAITEDRPYRAGMKRRAAKEVLAAMTAEQALCPYVVSLLERHFNEINAVRIAAQQQSEREYAQFIQND